MVMPLGSSLVYLSDIAYVELYSSHCSTSHVIESVLGCEAEVRIHEVTWALTYLFTIRIAATRITCISSHQPI
jgi:hypothetical protein